MLATSTSDDLAYVLLATNEPPRVELYGVVCRRRDGLWYDEMGASGVDGSTWLSTSDESDRGDLIWCREAPPGADCVRIRFRGVSHEVDAQNGYCVFLARNVPDTEEPEIEAWRVRGAWR